MNKFLLILALCLLATWVADADTVLVNEFAAYTDSADQSGADQVSENQAYDEGTKAMNENRWGDAERAFHRTADMRGKRADAALYWQAYAQNKEGRRHQAMQSCKSLMTSYPQSKWRTECDALLVDYRKTGNVSISDDERDDREDPNDEIKMLALNGLMQQDPGRALPIVKNILQSNNQSNRLKERALFVLAQSQSKEAQDILDQIALGNANPDLQVRAIHMLGAIKGKDARGFLLDIYKKSQDERVKDAALNGMFISNDATDLVAIARAESNPELKKKIVGKLSVMQSKEATDYMLELLSK